MFGQLQQPMQGFYDNQFYVVAMVLVIARLRRAVTTNRFFGGLFNLLGTFFHELSHYLVGLLLFAKPTGFSLWPKPQQGGGYLLGSVTFENIRFFNALPTALAPLLLVFMAYFVDKNFFMLVEKSLSSYIVYIFVLVILLENAIPSATDFKVAFSSFVGVVLYIGGGTLYLFQNQIADWLFTL